MIRAIDINALREQIADSARRKEECRRRRNGTVERRCDRCRLPLTAKNLTRCFICQRRRGGGK